MSGLNNIHENVFKKHDNNDSAVMNAVGFSANAWRGVLKIEGKGIPSRAN